MSADTHTFTVLRSVVQVLLDAHKVLNALGAEVKDEAAKRVLLEETQVRANFAAELENELHHLGVKDVEETGTATGTARRIWGDLKSILGGGDYTLLATAEQEEDRVKAKYAEALKQDLPDNIADLLRRQQVHILGSHDKIRGIRDSIAH